MNTKQVETIKHILVFLSTMLIGFIIVILFTIMTNEPKQVESSIDDRAVNMAVEMLALAPTPESPEYFTKKELAKAKKEFMSEVESQDYEAMEKMFYALVKAAGKIK